MEQTSRITRFTGRSENAVRTQVAVALISFLVRHEISKMSADARGFLDTVGRTLAAFRMLRPTIENIMRVGKSARAVATDTHAAHAEIIGALRDRDRVAYAYLIGRHLKYGLRFIAPATGRRTEMRGE